MRGTRWLLLVAIAAILCGIGITYRAYKRVQVEEAPPKPAPLPANLLSSSQRYRWTQTETKTGRVIADIAADDFKELKDSPRVDLTGVTIKLPSKKGDTYNLVKCATAVFFHKDHRLQSDDDVEITLNLPLVGEPKHQPITIKSSGVTLDTSTQKAETDKPSTFTFERGSGSATGATYDPETHALLMRSDASIDWTPAGPHAKPMRIEAGSLEYDEAKSEILLQPWGRLTRENMRVEGENVVIHMQDDANGNKVMRQVQAVKAHGTDEYPDRKLQYSADELWVDLDENGVVQKITPQTNAHLISTSKAAETTVDAYHVELIFEPRGHESILRNVSASGNSVVTSKPIPVAGRTTPETHVLRSDKIEMKMKEDGREIESVAALTPGTLEFLPNLPAQHHRVLEGKDMFIAYGARNHIESFRAADARTRTDPTADEVKRKVPQSVTSSKIITAAFEPGTSRVATMEQSGDFSYQQGDRRARAAKAVLDSKENIITLDEAARMWDSSGSTTGDRIRMDQRTGDFTAEGNVKSSRIPEKSQKKNSEMLSGDEPLHAQAAKMESSNRNRKVHYEGNVTLWQGANRIQADVVDIDREKRTLVADRNVVTNLWEQPKDDPKKPDPKKADPKKKAASPVLTVVHAAHLVYTDQDRQAVYTGGVLLERTGLEVRSRELRAFMAAEGADSQLEKAFADGGVRVVQTARSGVRTGTAEHAEYYTSEQKIFMNGGAPKMVERKPDGKVQESEGSDLTYYADDDRLVVNGSPAHPGQSRIQRK
jgi:lipopolysaccharide export system protein LptA